MGRTARRKQHKQAKWLNGLADTKTRCFLDEWGQRIVGWLQEINRRARAQRHDTTADTPTESVFGVLGCAENALAALKPEVRQLVAADTLNELQNACAGAVARVYDPRLYHVIDHCAYQKGRDWQRHRVAMEANQAPRRV